MEKKRKKEINECLLSIKTYRDMQSVCTLHSLMGGVLRHIALRYSGNVHDSDDIVQDFWADIFEIASKYRYNTNAFAFLCKSFTNTAINYCIKKGRDISKKVYYVDYENMASDNGNCIEGAVLESVVESAISQLDDDEKAVVQLTYFEDMTVREIAKCLGRSKSQVSRIKISALQNLKQKLEGYEDTMNVSENKQGLVSDHE